jgi:ribosomal protein L11 methyltransferase
MTGGTMTQTWVDVRIATELDAGEVISRLDLPDVRGAWQDGGLVHLYWPRDQWSQDHLARLYAALRDLNPSRALPAVEVEQVPDCDWNRLWARSVKPLRIGRRLVIRPSWESVALQPGELDIILDPKQAFGTGHHPTTRMLLEWLEDDIRGGETVLDVGTGSGLLAMAALRFGAGRAIGLDHDPVAIECACSYQRENGFGQELELICDTLSNLTGLVRPGLVLANLDRHTLLMLADDLAGYGKEGAALLLSGVLLDQETEILERYARRGLYLADRREREEWVALKLLQPESCDGSE